MILFLLFLFSFFLAEGFSGFAMFARFLGSADASGRFYYSFASMALVLVFGTALDLLRSKYREKFPADWSVIGVIAGAVLLLIGGFTDPFVLGAGRALLYAGSVTGVLVFDRELHKKGVFPGFFLAAGTLGLFLGKYLGAYTPAGSYFLVAGAFIAVFAILSVLLFLFSRKVLQNRRSAAFQAVLESLPPEEREFRFGSEKPLTKLAAGAIALCFLSALLREFFSVAVSFSWTETPALSLVATLSVALGSALGGLFAAKSSFTMGILFTLGPAAFLLWFKDTPVLGVMGLFLFNMSLPVTLYMVSNRLKDMPGLSAGLLSFAGFLGVLPAYFGLRVPFSDHIFAALAAGLMLILLFLALVLLVSEHKKAK